MMHGQAGSERLDLSLLAPRHMQRHLLAATDGLGGKRLKLTELQQHLAIGNPGGEQRAKGRHVAIKFSQLLQRESSELCRQLRSLVGKGHGQVVIGLILPPAPMADQQLIQLLKALRQHRSLYPAVKRRLILAIPL